MQHHRLPSSTAAPRQPALLLAAGTAHWRLGIVSDAMPSTSALSTATTASIPFTIPSPTSKSMQTPVAIARVLAHACASQIALGNITNLRKYSLLVVARLSLPMRICFAHAALALLRMTDIAFLSEIHAVRAVADVHHDDSVPLPPLVVDIGHEFCRVYLPVQGIEHDANASRIHVGVKDISRKYNHWNRVARALTAGDVADENACITANGKVLLNAKERSRVAEPLFDDADEHRNLGSLVLETVASARLYDRSLSQNILLCGGGAALHAMSNRIHQELHSLTEKHSRYKHLRPWLSRIKFIDTPPFPPESLAYYGAAVLYARGLTQHISSDQYASLGASAVPDPHALVHI